MCKNLMPKVILVIVLLLLVIVFIGAGCTQRSHEEDILAVEPNIAALTVTSDYASGAIGATGGLDAWAKTIKLELDGVVTFYSTSGSDKSGVSRRQPSQRHPIDFYLTEHHFEIYPWSNSIRISAQEPLSKFVWQLSNGRFKVLAGDRRLDVSSSGVSYQDYAEAVFSIITAPTYFLNKSVDFIKAPKPVKIEGRWYYPIEQTYPVERATFSSDLKDIAPVELHWPKVVFFQNKDSFLTDIIWFANSAQSKFLVVRGYDYQEFSPHLHGPQDGLRHDKLTSDTDSALISTTSVELRESKFGDVLVPTKIEIFRTDDRSHLVERLVKIDFKSK